MTKFNFYLWFVLIFFSLAAGSCGKFNTGKEKLDSETPTLLIHATRTATLLPVSTDTPTPSPTRTSTLTLVPTLPAEEARAQLLKLLSDNGGCRLPCLWGITPGISVNNEAQSILVPLSNISELTVFGLEGGGIVPIYSEGNLQVYTRVSFTANPDNDIVNRIVFNTEAHRLLAEAGYEDVFDSNIFGVAIDAFVLPRVLSEQGIPSSVRIATSGGPLTRGGTGGFDILILYPDQGILVNYTTQMHLTGANVRGCPSNAHVEMELYRSGNGDSFFELLEQTNWAVKMGYYKPLEEVTTMSIEEFYQTFREPTDKCIETSANLWSTPEP